MKKIFYQLLIFCFLLLPNFVLAEVNEIDAEKAIETKEEVFEAEVVSIQESQQMERPDGSFSIKQDVILKGLKGKWKDKKIISKGINDLEVSHSFIVKEGDRVLVSYFKDVVGDESFYIIDMIRRTQLLWILFFFCALMVVIGKSKGFNALISLALSIAVIFYLIVPGVLAGYNPLLITIASCFILLIAMIYITWGWKLKSHLALLSMAISLAFTAIISWVFVGFAKLSGLGGEDILFLMSSNNQTINFKGLLLAGMVIGALGVLDDVVISQISSVKELSDANNNLSAKELFKRGMRIGTDHISSMTNTLFLAYAGAGLPLLLLFKINDSAFSGVSQIINSEMIATEIVRTLSGSIGLILAMPIATFIAAKYFKQKRLNKNKKD